MSVLIVVPVIQMLSVLIRLEALIVCVMKAIVVMDLITVQVRTEYVYCALKASMITTCYILDVNECLSNEICEDVCEDTDGSYICRCPNINGTEPNGPFCVGNSEMISIMSRL